jgi:hypothetical protein
LPVTGSVALTISRQAPSLNRLWPFTAASLSRVGWRKGWRASERRSENRL